MRGDYLFCDLLYQETVGKVVALGYRSFRILSIAIESVGIFINSMFLTLLCPHPSSQIATNDSCRPIETVVHFDGRYLGLRREKRNAR
jgi:hypothetical protein